MNTLVFPRTAKRLSVYGSLLAIILFIGCDDEAENELKPGQASFSSFTISGQTSLGSYIDGANKAIKVETMASADLSSVKPVFTISSDFQVFAGGVEQISGVTEVDLRSPVTYEVRSGDKMIANWEATAFPMQCRIIIDASHDGGVWWYPQHEGTGFNPDEYHQGQAFANVLRDKGFDVTEIGRGKELSEEMFFGNYIVIRVGGFQAYTSKELEVYEKLISRGMNLVFFTDHKANDPSDELEAVIGVTFKGSATTTLSNFAAHTITDQIETLSYIAGSALSDYDETNFTPLAWLPDNVYADFNFNGEKDSDEPMGAPVMGIVDLPKSRVFVMGDVNALQVQPQPFIDNLINWMGDCSAM